MHGAVVLIIRRSWVRAPPAPPGGLHVSVGLIFTFGSVILAGCGLVPVSCAGGVLVAALCVSGAGCGHAAAVVLLCWVALVAGGVCAGGGERRAWLWWRGEAGGGLAAAFAGFRGEPGGGPARVVFLPCVPGGEDPLVADDEQAGDGEHEGRQAHQAAPAAADVVGGGGLGGGEAACGAGAAGVGPAVRGGGVVVFLRGLGGGLGRDGDGLLCAAGRGVLRRGEDLGPVAVQRHRGGAERAADLADGGGALDPVVPVGIVAGEAAELVAGEFGGPGVVRRGLVPRLAAGQRAEFQQGAGRGRAVQAAGGDDGAVVGAFGAAVVRVQVLDQSRAGGPERDRPGACVAVRVAGIGEDIAERDAGSGHRRQDGRERADRVVAA